MVFRKIPILALFAAQCRGEAFAINCHKCVHTQTGKCIAHTFSKN
ncbi:hypothetical protein KsCSTR_01280 [Candidatus Kuenenia stuttgartiensis]|uniref:Uncharacterized protein n=1 Tax=Kuenenia stuttgartiensis TaxID=174633 RepID=Q1PV19_KUEST|nr:hypothetical protein KsCSTR_01280 [Candidatus Kuenenia stuttgartiensis]CAJ71073.1 unknown protein [Candidatus Kuenenia stuttgartiensis]